MVYDSTKKPNILLTSVFGPYAVDSEKYGLAKPMELPDFHFSRGQGPFSVRVFAPSDGLRLIQANIDAPCTLLDFPSEKRFIQEIKRDRYDIIAISSIILNLNKVIRMCELIRKHSPHSTIVVGGYIALIDDVKEKTGADYIAKGDGVRWFREFLGQDTNVPMRHPFVRSGFGMRVFGIPIHKFNNYSALLIFGSAGCPNACDFCSTSQQFGGLGKWCRFYQSAEDLFSVMDQISRKAGVNDFSFSDPNFFKDTKKVRRLLELVQKHKKKWRFFALSSIDALNKFSMDELTRIGLDMVFIGIEDPEATFAKNCGENTVGLVKRFRSHGISVIGAMILGLENHSDDSLERTINKMIEHDSDFHQFSLLVASPGTALYDQLEKDGKIKSEEEYPLANWHGHDLLNFHHDKITPGTERYYIHEVFRRDFKRNGPCVTRIFETKLNRQRKYKNHPNKGIRERVRSERTEMKYVFTPAIYASRMYLRKDKHLFRKMDKLLKGYYKEFGVLSRIVSSLLGPFVYLFMKREDRLRANGFLYEPPTQIVQNKAAIKRRKIKGAMVADYVVPRRVRG